LTSRWRCIVENKVNSLAVAIVDHMMHHDVVQLERKMRARRHALGAHHEFNTAIGYERNVNPVSNRKGRMGVFVPSDPAAGRKPGDHGSPKRTACGIIFRDNLVNNGHRLISKQIPAARAAHLDVGPSFAKKQNNRLRLSVHVIIGLPPVVGMPRQLIQRQHLFGERRAVELSERDGCLIQYHVTTLIPQVPSSIP
jgi:hypothetical protein